MALLGRELHRAGVPVSSAETDCLARVLELCRPTTVDQLYWCARVSLLRSVDSLGPFDALFALVFRGLVDIADHRGQAAPVSPEARARSLVAPLTAGRARARRVEPGVGSVR